jgi:hypothetical protein
MTGANADIESPPGGLSVPPRPPWRRVRAVTRGDEIGNAIADFGPPGDPGDDLDPAAELRALAGRLAAVHQEDPSRADIARELRATLLAIQVPDEDTELAELMRGFADT